MPDYYLLSCLSAVCTFLLYIPFVNLLYKLKMQDPERAKGRLDKFGQPVAIFDSIKGMKVGTPTGGGVLVVLFTLLAFYFLCKYLPYDISVQNWVLISSACFLFGLIGFYDDIKKVFKLKGAELRVRHKLFIQFFAGALVSYLGVKYNLFMLRIPVVNAEVDNKVWLFFIGVAVIVFMSNAFNILDGIDGLSAGSLLISLVTMIIFLVKVRGAEGAVVFGFLLFGSVLAYLYFNINPARIFMGDTGALAFGAVLGVFLMLSGEAYLLPVVFAIYVVDAFSSIVQWISKYFRHGKGVFKIAPLHHHFEALGWDGNKVVMRFWVFHVFANLLALSLHKLLG